MKWLFPQAGVAARWGATPGPGGGVRSVSGAAAGAHRAVQD
jgi:hypothetical protein